MTRKHVVILDENVTRARQFSGLLSFAGIPNQRLSARQMMDKPPISAEVRAFVVGDIPDSNVSVLMQARRQEFPEAPVIAFSPHPRVTGEHNSRVLKDPYDLESISHSLLGSIYENRRQQQPLLTRLYQQLLKKIKVIAPCHASVTLVGESALVRAQIARQIHEQSKSHGPFVKITCYERVYGAIDIFSSQQYENSVRLLNGGTLFLDRIDRLSKSSQQTLLSMLRNKAIGQEQQSKRGLDFRLLAGALPSSNTEARVLPELWHRLSICRLELPYLPKRLTDITDLLAELVAGTNLNNLASVAESFRSIHAYGWPENLRELAEAAAWLKLMLMLNPSFRFPCEQVSSFNDLLACLELLPQKLAYSSADRAQHQATQTLATLQ